MSAMNAIKFKRCSNSHENYIKTHEIFTILKTGRRFTKVALERHNVLFQYLGYSIHFTLISFSFIIEGGLILYILLVVFHITLSTITAAV